MHPDCFLLIIGSEIVCSPFGHCNYPPPSLCHTLLPLQPFGLLHNRSKVEDGSAISKPFTPGGVPSSSPREKRRAGRVRGPQTENRTSDVVSGFLPGFYGNSAGSRSEVSPREALELHQCCWKCRKILPSVSLTLSVSL